MGILIFVFVFNFFSTWYFGWNMHPESPWEHASDHLCMMLFAVGFTQIIVKAAIKEHQKKYHGKE